MNRIDKCLLKAIRKIVVTADADSLIALSRYPAIEGITQILETRDSQSAAFETCARCGLQPVAD
jgi:hypothetical protein